MRRGKQSKQPLLLGLLFTVLSVLFIFAVKYIDLEPLGLEGSNIGLAELNVVVSDAIGLNMFWYKISQMLGYVALVVVAFFALCGVLQLIKRRSLLKVDRGILCMGILFIVTMILYIFFDKWLINYRPFILPGELAPESSFPSSHTMLAVVVFGATIIEFGRRLGRGAAYKIIKIIMLALMVVSVLARILSGAHWISDIIGGLLISFALIMYYKYFSGLKTRR